MSPCNSGGGDGEFNPAGPQRKAPAYMFNSSEDGSAQDEGEMMSGLNLENKAIGDEIHGMRHNNFNIPAQGV
jgi:hypothetical protein